MKTQAIVPARIVFDHPDRPGQPYAVDHDDVYRPRDGEFEQASHVFVAGHGLPARWQGRKRFTVLETGFGLGHNFLATWRAWRDDPNRCERLVFVSIEKHPPERELLARAHAASTAPELTEALVRAWPPLTHDLHTLAFEDGQVTLLLAFGDVGTWLPEIVAKVDAFDLDGFAPARNAEMWDRRVFKACARLAAEHATATTWSLARTVHEGLAAAGFDVMRTPGFGSRAEMTSARLRTLPRREEAPGRRPAPSPRTALVIGAGLAGASAADALARQGLEVTVLERHADAAQETSGNIAGLFHGVLHAQDGVHAQLLRAAALRAAQVYPPMFASGAVAGSMDGLLRGAGADAAVEAMQALLTAQGLPATYVEALSAQAASGRAGCTVSWPAWLYPNGGWLSPSMLVHTWLKTPGVTLRTGAEVTMLRQDDGGNGAHQGNSDANSNNRRHTWHALDGAGAIIASADVVVVANAAQAPALLAPHADTSLWPLRRSRGQVTQMPPGVAERLGLPAAGTPRLPLASGAYLMALPPELGGGHLCGATSRLDDDEPQLLLSDHVANLKQAGVLVGSGVDLDALGTDDLPGRVGWRLAAEDRLPLVGPVPLHADPRDEPGPGREQPRNVARCAGLYVFTALGSRGITLAPLLGEALAAWVCGAPVPLAASLVDAIDPARFVSRQVRQSARPAD